MALAAEFQRYIDTNGLASPDDRILLAVSGGVDSMVMLDLFVKAGYRTAVAHCNFQLRGTESDKDEALVEAEAARRGVPYFNRRFDTAGEMERTGESMEMAARRLRYTWFDALCRAEGYTVVAVAHHADDAIETFFINLLRGTGLRGLTGISMQIGRIIRPLMFASRKEILDYAKTQRIPFREDASNLSTKYLRNKIRLGVIPRIREFRPNFTYLMRRNLARLTAAQRFIDRSIARIRSEAVLSEGGVDTICTERIDPEYPADFVIYELLNSGYGFKGDVVDALCAALRQGVTGRRFYARDWVAVPDRGRIVVSRIDDGDECIVTVQQNTVRSYCGNSVLYYDHTDISTVEQFDAPPHIALLDAAKLTYPLTLRRWREGDRFVPFGMTGSKKVSDFLIDAKVSLPEKQRQFVLVSGEDIVWVVGRRIDDRYRLTEESDNVLRIIREIV